MLDSKAGLELFLWNLDEYSVSITVNETYYTITLQSSKLEKALGEIHGDDGRSCWKIKKVPKKKGFLSFSKESLNNPCKTWCGNS